MHTTIIGWRRNGTPILSICGGSDDGGDPGTGDDAGAGTDPEGEDDSGGGEPAKGDGDGTDWKSHAREWERRAKANADAAKKLQEIEDANKSETEKLTDRASTAERKAATAEAKAMRLEVAMAKAPDGMSSSQILKLSKRLAGDTREELEADADELFADFAGGGGKPAGDKPKPTRKPQPRLTGGADPDDEPEEDDPRKLAAKVPRL